MRLIDYIKKNYRGNVSAYANAKGIKRQQVATCIDKGNYHLSYYPDDEGVERLHLVQVKREIIEAI